MYMNDTQVNSRQRNILI